MEIRNAKLRIMKEELKIKNFKLVLVTVLLVSLAIIERLWLDLGPNVELTTLVTFLAAFYLNCQAALIVGVLSLAISDIFLGNTNIAIFTWSAYGGIAIGAFILKRISYGRQEIFWATAGGVMASLWFYVWTNFGVWLLDEFNMYPDTLNGLIQSYINGLPFFKFQLTGNLLIVPLGFGLIEFIKYLISYKKLNFSLLHGRM